MAEIFETVYTPEHVKVGQRNPDTGEITVVGDLPSPSTVIVNPPVERATFDPKNYISILVYSYNTFDLTPQQFMDLRTRVEKTFHAQPQVFSKHAPAPATLNAVAITYGLLIGFGGFKDALKASADRVVKVARGYDPFGDLDKDTQKMMHRRAQMNRRGRR